MKPEKRRINKECPQPYSQAYETKIPEIKGYNQACDKWEAYHNQEMAKLQKHGGCGGGWRYDEMRNCFVNQMGDIR